MAVKIMSKRRKFWFVVTCITTSLFGGWIIMIAEPIEFIGWCLSLCAPMFFVEWLWKRHLKKRKERKRVQHTAYCYGLTEADLVTYRSELRRLESWLDENQHLRGTKEWEDVFAKAEGLHETVHNL